MKAQRRKVKGRRLDALYFCSAAFCVGIMADPLERHVANVLFDELDKPDFLDAIAADDHAERRDESAAELSALEAKRGDLAELWGSGTLPARNGRPHVVPSPSMSNGYAPTRGDPAADDYRRHRNRAGILGIDDPRRAARVLCLFVDRVVIRRARSGTRGFDPDRVDVEWRKL